MTTTTPIAQALAPYVRILGRGPSRARNLTQDEAREAMEIILTGRAAPEAIGALLMLMRYRGENAAEIAGFVTALRASLPGWDGARPALDWPSYAAGRTRSVPWFLLSAKLVARAGYPVLIHGWNSHQNPVASVRGGLVHAGIDEAPDMPRAAEILARDGIAYLPLETIGTGAHKLLKLRDVLGLRSAVNTSLKLLNPGGAAASVQGVFHPSYRELQVDAGELLGQEAMAIIKGGGGEFECHPSKAVAVFGRRAGARFDTTHTPIHDETRRLAEEDAAPEDIARLWAGTLEAPFARDVVLSTAALALETLGQSDGMAQAAALWEARK